LGEAAVYAHCFEKIGSRLKKTRVSIILPNFLNFHFLKNYAAYIIPVLLAQVTNHSGIIQDYH
jgi:hypothetical protein